MLHQFKESLRYLLESTDRTDQLTKEAFIERLVKSIEDNSGTRLTVIYNNTKEWVFEVTDHKITKISIWVLDGLYSILFYNNVNTEEITGILGEELVKAANAYCFFGALKKNVTKTFTE